MVQEIHQANQEGRLHVRSILPLPDSRLDKVFSVLPKAIIDSYFPLVYQPSQVAGNNPPSFTMRDFSTYLNRRDVHPDWWHSQFTKIVCFVYQGFYPIFLLALAGFVIASAVLGKLRNETPDVPFLAQQIFLVIFCGLLACYVLFSASGLPLVPRYLTYHSLLIPILSIYYGCLMWRLLETKPITDSSEESMPASGK